MTLTIRDEGGVRWLVFDDPAAMNAIRLDDLAVLRQALTDIPDTVRVAIFTGSGEKSFSAGMHLSAFEGLTAESGRAVIAEIGGAMDVVQRAPIPTIAAINGYCLGGALEFALACDLRVASTTASIGMPEIALGFPSVLYAALLADHVGPSLANELVLTGDRIPVSRFASTGLLNSIVEPGELVAAATALAARMSRHSPTALAAQRRLFTAWRNLGLDAAVMYSVATFAEQVGSMANSGETI